MVLSQNFIVSLHSVMVLCAAALVCSLVLCNIANVPLSFRAVLCQLLKSLCLCVLFRIIRGKLKEAYQIAIPHPHKHNRCECSPSDCTFGLHHKGVGAHIALPQFLWCYCRHIIGQKPIKFGKLSTTVR